VPVTGLTLAVLLNGQIIYILLSGTAEPLSSPDGAISPSLASALHMGEPRPKT